MSDYLCEELIIEIFTRLPSKSLLRFRSLSKSLCSCIASPGFIRRHTSRSPQKVLITHFVDNIREYGNRRNGYFYTLHSDDQLPLCPKRGYTGLPVVELPYNSLSIIGSCNGIVCLVGYRNENRISLWNPSIKLELTLPDCHVRCSPSCLMNTCGCGVLRFRIGLGIYATGLGFGFDPITDDYKIVCLPIFGGMGASSLMYKMKTGAWCAITSPTPLFYEVTSRGCFTNGALHWMVKCFEHTRLDGVVGGFYILTFNLSTHVFGKIVLPYYSWEINQYLTTFQGSLAVISTKEDDIWIWVMREYGNTASWSVVSKSKTNRLEGPVERVLRLTNNGDLLFETFNRRFEVYDSKKGERSRLMELTVDSCISDMEMFVESLQLFDMGTNCRGRQVLFN